MAFKDKIKSIVKILISLTYIFVTSVSVSLSCISSKDYKLDKIAYDLNNYNEHDYYNGFVSPILKIHQNPSGRNSENRSERYDDVFEQFYYNSFVKHLRQYASNDITDEIINSKLKVFSQKTYSCRNAVLPAGGHYVDYGVFASYYGDNLFESRPSGDPRSHGYFPYTDCVTFAYISDSYADSLIEFYKQTEPDLEIKDYKDLIFKKPVLPIVAIKSNNDGTKTEYRINVSINNILYSNKRHAPRIAELYGENFALIDLYSYGRKTRDWADLVCEMDLKVDPFSTKNVIKGLETLGYNPDNSSFQFYKYDYSNKSYYLDSNITHLYSSSYRSSGSNALFYCLLTSFVVGFLVMSLLFVRKDSIFRNLTTIIYLTISLIFGIVATFIYFYPLWSVLPICLICIGVGTNMVNLIKSKRRKEKENFEINI